MQTPFKAANYRLSSHSKTLLRWTASPPFPCFVVFFWGVFLKEKSHKANSLVSRLQTKHISSVLTQGETRGCENTTEPLLPPTPGSQGRRAGRSPLRAACLAPLTRPNDGQNLKKKTAGKRCKRQKKAGVGETAGGSCSQSVSHPVSPP